MAYEGQSAYPRIALKAIRKSFDFTNRSTRTEVIVYYFATLLIGFVLGLVTMFALDFESGQRIDKAYGWISGIPFIALFVRRLHDQNRTGWWVLFPLAVASFNAIFEVIAAMNGVQAAFEARRAVGYVDWLIFAITLGVLAAILIPGDQGPNRFGSDPRGRDS